MALLILHFYPVLDIKFSRLFYSSVQGFTYRDHLVILWFFYAVPLLTKILIAVCLISLLLQRLKCLRLVAARSSSAALYMIMAGLIGPGLIVNYALKEHSGRARPSQISHFNGTKNFSPALMITDQCRHNCSFSSGHAAMAYYFSAAAYLPCLLSRQPLNSVLNCPVWLRSRKQKNFFSNWIYCLTLLFGSLVGMSRIIMGGHFLSDVVASCFIILTVNYLLYLWWLRPKLI